MGLGRNLSQKKSTIFWDDCKLKKKKYNINNIEFRWCVNNWEFIKWPIELIAVNINHNYTLMDILILPFHFTEIRKSLSINYDGEHWFVFIIYILWESITHFISDILPKKTKTFSWETRHNNNNNAMISSVNLLHAISCSVCSNFMSQFFFNEPRRRSAR